MSPEREKDFDLVERYLSGRASAEESQVLEGRLSADAKLRREFLCYAHVDAALTTMVRPVAQQPLAAPKGKTTAWRTAAVGWAAAAAVIIAAAWMLWMPGDVNVRVLAVSDDLSLSWTKGALQRLSEVKLDHGSLQLQLDSGVKLEVSAPVHLRLGDSMHATLLDGGVTADVGEFGKGFVIDTASARVVDLGTRFGVAVGKDGETDVAVFHGKVEVVGKAQPDMPASLVAGQAVRVAPRSAIRRLINISTRGEVFSVMAPLPADALVTSVTDNVDDGGNYSFYTLQHRQMRPGARPYSTLGRPRWQALPGETFPDEMLGADIVGTFSPDRHDPDLELSVAVSRPCTMYLMFDARSDVPDWVRRDFVESGIRLRSGPWAANPVVQGMTADASGEIFVTYSVWKRVVQSAGVVKLRAAYPGADGRNRAMFGIAVK